MCMCDCVEGPARRLEDASIAFTTRPMARSGVLRLAMDVRRGWSKGGAKVVTKKEKRASPPPSAVDGLVPQQDLNHLRLSFFPPRTRHTIKTRKLHECVLLFNLLKLTRISDYLSCDQCLNYMDSQFQGQVYHLMTQTQQKFIQTSILNGIRIGLFGS